MDVSPLYCSVGCSRTPHAVSWHENGIIAFAANKSLALASYRDVSYTVNLVFPYLYIQIPISRMCSRCLAHCMVTVIELTAFSGLHTDAMINTLHKMEERRLYLAQLILQLGCGQGVLHPVK